MEYVLKTDGLTKSVSYTHLFLGFFHNDFAAAFGAFGPGILYQFFDILTFRISRAGDKFSIPSGLNDHFTPALFTNDIRFILFELDFNSLHLFFGLF